MPSRSFRSDLVLKSTNEKVPFFNAPIYLADKTEIGKIDEIFGSITDVHFTVKTGDKGKSLKFKNADKLHINPEKLLPMARFTNPPKMTGGAGGRGGGRGGRGGDRGRGGGRGAPRGGGRGAPRGGGMRGGGRGAPRGAPRGGGFRGRG